jgi:hypothetical protein
MKFLWRVTSPHVLTISHRKNTPAHAREVSDLSAKIMMAMARRHRTAASTRVNCA